MSTSQSIRVLFIGGTAAIAEIRRAIEDVRRSASIEIELRWFSDAVMADVRDIEDSIRSSDLVIIDTMGASNVVRAVRNALAYGRIVVVVFATNAKDLELIRMGRFDGHYLTAFAMGDLDVESLMALATYVKQSPPRDAVEDAINWATAVEYYLEGGPENMKNMLSFLLSRYVGIKAEAKPPVKIGDYVFYVPRLGVFQDFDEYRRVVGFDQAKPTVGILCYWRSFTYYARVVDSLYDCLKDTANLVVIAIKNYKRTLEVIKRYLSNADLIIRLTAFNLGDTHDVHKTLNEVGSLLLQGIVSYYIDLETWLRDRQGLSPIEVVMSVALPEVDGTIEPIIISTHDRALAEPQIIGDRVERRCERIKRWLELRRKPNSEKRIAIVLYNYPPGEAHLGNAGYLDTFRSLERFLAKLREAGYKVEIPSRKIEDFLLENGIINSPEYTRPGGIRIPLEKYLSWFNELPEGLRKRVVEVWGQPPGNIMVEDGKIILPIVVLGNVAIGLQPPRGPHDDPEKAYHDREIPPPHQYIAFYMYLQREFRADAIIHWGMHGTLEFLPGKEVALSSEDAPDALIGNVPNAPYLYWVGNPAESTIAKRRSYAATISHASPPMTSSGLYGEYLVLEDLLRQYEEGGGEGVLKEIKSRAKKLNLPEEPKQLEVALRRIRRSLMPKGLHVLDDGFSTEDIVEYLLGVLRIDREHPSILKYVMRRWGNLGPELLEEKARGVIRDILSGKAPDWLPSEYVKYVLDLAKRLTECCPESQALLRTLDGRYVTPAISSDPLRSPEVYPTGKLMYGLDPRRIPTVEATIKGERAAEELLRRYYAKHGRYPETVGLVAWAIETLRTGGETIAMALRLLGVRVKQHPWFKEIEVIPLSELGRPRIDVVLTMSGIFRDFFGLHIDLINKAVEAVAKLDEPPQMNYVRKHYLEMVNAFGDSSLIRTFAEPPGEYGPRLEFLIHTGAWRTYEDLAKVFIMRMAHAYGRGLHGVKMENLYTSLLKTTDAVAKVRDNVEYSFIDNDDYYQYLGGLATAVAKVRGNYPVSFSVDTSTETGEELVVEEVGDSIDRWVRSRLLNPRWMEGMLKHGYKGVHEIANRIEFTYAMMITTNNVKQWIFDEIARVYVFDENMRKKLEKENPYAMVEIIDLLEEAAERGYWRTESLEALRYVKEVVEASIKLRLLDKGIFMEGKKHRVWREWVRGVQ